MSLPTEAVAIRDSECEVEGAATQPVMVLPGEANPVVPFDLLQPEREMYYLARWDQISARPLNGWCLTRFASPWSARSTRDAPV